jgi:hypothetical protein
MLVVMEDRDVHAVAQGGFDHEAFRRLDVFQIDAAEGRLQRGHRIDELVDVQLIDLDVEHVYPGKFLEKDRLAFHHRFGGERADVAKPEDRGAVGDHGDQIAARGIVGGLCRILGNLKTGRGDARRIGQRQVALVAERFGRLDFQLAGLWMLVKEQGSFGQVAFCFVIIAHDVLVSLPLP